MLQAMRTRSLTVAYSTLVGLRRPLIARTLADLAAGRLELDHAALDQLPHTDLVDQLRELLVSHQVLPSRDRLLVRFDNWTVTKLAAISNPAQRSVIEQFITWHHQRRLRALSEQGQLRQGHILTGRQSVTVAAQFLDRSRRTWPRPARTSPSRPRLVAGRTTHHPLARRAPHRLGPRDPPSPRRPHAHQSLRNTNPAQPPDHIELLGRLFHDDQLALPVRISGALVLLYAHPVTATAQLTIDDVRVNNDPAVRLGHDFIPLLDPLAKLIAGQIDTATRPRGQGHPSSRWLFPGGKPGHHLGAGHLHNRLQAAGIDIRASKNTAIAAMITELPGPVVADALHLHPSTIDRWARNLATPWQNYASRPTR